MIKMNDMGHQPSCACSLTELELLNKFYNCYSARSREDNIYPYKYIPIIDKMTQAHATDE